MRFVHLGSGRSTEFRHSTLAPRSPRASNEWLNYSRIGVLVDESFASSERTRILSKFSLPSRDTSWRTWNQVVSPIIVVRVDAVLHHELHVKINCSSTGNQCWLIFPNHSI